MTARLVLVPWRGRVLRGELLGKLDGENRGYREDLGLGTKAQVHPANVWSLRGLNDCLRAGGAGGWWTKAT